METETKNNTSETTQITFKLSQDERQTIEQSAGDLDLNISEYCRLKSLMDENTVVMQRKKLNDMEKLIKILKVNLDFYKSSTRAPEDIVIAVTEEQRSTLEYMFDDFKRKDESIDSVLIDILFSYYRKMKDEKYAGFDEKITMDEAYEIFYPDDDDDEI
jgi:hypothetical protein